MNGRSTRLYAGMFLIAFSALALEITLARFLSVVTWYHLAFFAVSVAMLGMTAGAVRVYLKPDDFADDRRDASLRTAARGYVFDVLLMLAVLCLVPIQLRRSAWTPVCFLLVTLTCTLPFYRAGVIVSALLTRTGLPTGKLYACDLAGAALGCLFVLLALPALDAPGVFIVCAGIGALAGALFRPARDGRGAMVEFGLFVLALAVAAGNAVSPVKIVPRYVKGMPDSQSVHLVDRWNTISRVIVYAGERAPPQLWGGSPVAPTNLIESFYMNIDGEAATVLRRFREPDDLEHLRYDVTNIGHFLQPTNRTVCVIGVGGGRDLQSALLFGCREATGLEINPIFVRLLTGLFADFAGLAHRPDVRLVVDDARSWLTTHTNTFDFLQMSLIDTWAATGAGAFSLSENGLYTVEAWQTFLRRLSPDGLFTVSRWHKMNDLGETGRLVSLAVASLLRSGVRDPARHLALVTSTRCCTLLVCRRPFTAEEIALLETVCRRLYFEPAILPGRPPAHERLRAMLAAGDDAALRAAIAGSDLNYEPPTDDDPYFFNMLRLSNLGRYRTETFSIVRGNLTATLTLLGLLGALTLIAASTVILPLRLRPAVSPRPPLSAAFRWGALYFCLLGAGFMLAEIALMQRLSVFLGHPVYAMGVLLFTLIASTGAGSFMSGLFAWDRGRWRTVAPLLVTALLLAMIWFVPAVARECMAASLAVRCLVAVVMIAPLGLLLGGFFPVGLTLAKRAGIGDTPWYWALNGVFGVLCSALAVFISIYGGISWNLVIAAACYALTWPCLRALSR